MLDDSFIDAFVAATDQNNLFGFREAQRFGLVEFPTGCAEHHHLGMFTLLNRLDRFENRFRFENHSFAAPERPVVNGPMPIRSEIPQVMDSDVNESRPPAAPDNPVIKWAAEERREDCNDIEQHRQLASGPPSGLLGYIATRPPYYRPVPPRRQLASGPPSGCFGTSPSQSLVQIPQVFRQVHFDLALIQFDPFQVLLCEWNERFFVLSIDFQNFSAASIEHIRDCSNVFAVCRNHAATFQLERIKPTLFGGRQC